ncbi:MAG TPA: hypothetical protein VMI54_04325 [Polyangiaceae bacterium]|nr:hypothetical protein [Polyangiaceae bacterium]
MQATEFGSKHARTGALILVLAAVVALFGCGGRSSRSDPSSSSTAAAGTATGGTDASGGAPGMASGGATGDERSCAIDADCTQCIYVTVPATAADCGSALGCCGGVVVNQATCAVHQAAFQSLCAGQNVSPPICPCVLGGEDCGVSCVEGECGFGCTGFGGGSAR